MPKYSWSEQRIAKSPFARGKTVKEARAFAKQKEKDFGNGKSIGFTYTSSLKSMGRIKRSDGEYRLGDKYD